MTRKKAIELIDKQISIEDINFRQCIERDDALDIIHLIYDDFESRICMNCKYDFCGCSIQDMIMNFTDKHNLEQIDFSDFGCNRFERKDDEQNN